MNDAKSFTREANDATLETIPAPRKRDGRKENSAQTQAALLAAGRKLFGVRGFEATSVGDLCTEAGVTTGALYHHYRDKTGLFAAVAEALDAGLVQTAIGARQKAAEKGQDLWQSFLFGIDALLDAGADPSGRRIGIIDAPAVLGAQGWEAIRNRHGLGALTRVLTELQSAGLLVEGDPRRLARVILGMLYGAIETLPENADKATVNEIRAVTHLMLAGLRRVPAAGHQ